MKATLKYYSITNNSNSHYHSTKQSWLKLPLDNDERGEWKKAFAKSAIYLNFNPSSVFTIYIELYIGYVTQINLKTWLDETMATSVILQPFYLDKKSIVILLFYIYW